uniref:Uncharacterized protein n=1 Tax=Meloidogyne javanica TaxID=6303 RepID=A0A915N5H1_MELJA
MGTDCRIEGKSGVFGHAALLGGGDSEKMIQDGDDSMGFELAITENGGLNMTVDGKKIEENPRTKPTQKPTTTEPSSNAMVFVIGGVIFVVALIVAAGIFFFVVKKKKADPPKSGKGGDSTAANSKVDEKARMKEKSKVDEKAKEKEKDATAANSKVDEKAKEKPNASQCK